MLSQRLRWWGNAAAGFAFVLPLLCFALTLTLCVFRLQEAASTVGFCATLIKLTAGLVWLCGGSGLATLFLGYERRSRRLLWQGGFTLAVFVMLFCIGYSLNESTRWWPFGVDWTGMGRPSY